MATLPESSPKRPKTPSCAPTHSRPADYRYALPLTPRPVTAYTYGHLAGAKSGRFVEAAKADFWQHC